MEQYFISNPWLIALAVIWTIPWKGVALWKTARRSSKVWFIVLLVANTLAILDILYIYVWGKDKKVQAQEGAF